MPRRAVALDDAGIPVATRSDNNDMKERNRCKYMRLAEGGELAFLRTRWKKADFAVELDLARKLLKVLAVLWYNVCYSYIYGFYS